MDALITSSKNPKVKFLRSLRLRRAREESGSFVVEGIRIVEEALELGAPDEPNFLHFRTIEGEG